MWTHSYYVNTESHTHTHTHACKQIVPRDAAAFLRIRPLASLSFKHGNVGQGLPRRSDTTLSCVCVLMEGGGLHLVFACASLFSVVAGVSIFNPSTCVRLLGRLTSYLLQLINYYQSNKRDYCTHFYSESP